MVPHENVNMKWYHIIDPSSCSPLNLGNRKQSFEHGIYIYIFNFRCAFNPKRWRFWLERWLGILSRHSPLILTISKTENLSIFSIIS